MIGLGGRINALAALSIGASLALSGCATSAPEATPQTSSHEATASQTPMPSPTPSVTPKRIAFDASAGGTVTIDQIIAGGGMETDDRDSPFPKHDIYYIAVKPGVPFVLKGFARFVMESTREFQLSDDLMAITVTPSGDGGGASFTWNGLASESIPAGASKYFGISLVDE